MKHNCHVHVCKHNFVVRYRDFKRKSDCNLFTDFIRLQEEIFTEMVWALYVISPT